MGNSAERVTEILWGWDNLSRRQFSEICGQLSMKTLRCLAAHHPDNRTRKELLRLSNVSVGRQSVINSGFIVSDDYKPFLKIGERVAISPNVTVICVSAPNNSLLGQLSLVQQRFIKAEPVVISDDSWIGAGAILLPGVTVGKGAIVGAGSIVARSIPDWSVAMGNPARVTRYLKNNSGNL